MQKFTTRTHEKMKEVLMHPEAAGPDAHYYMIRGGAEAGNITIWEPGDVGGEYIKTYGHYHVGDFNETYEVLSGEGILLLQKRATDPGGKLLDEVIEDFQAIQARQGACLRIPREYAHLMANTGKTHMVTFDDSPVNARDIDPVGAPSHADYEPMRRMRGFAYYVIEHNGKPALAKNPRYKEIRKTDFGGLSVV